MEPEYVVLIVALSIILIAAILIPIFCCRKKITKQKGGGITLKDDNTKTSFEFNENILPLIDKCIIDNDIVKRYLTAYADFVAKNITDGTKKDFRTNTPILIEAFSLYNKFMTIHKTVIKNKLEELRQLYYDLLFCDEYINFFNFVKGLNKVTSNNTIKQKLQELQDIHDTAMYASISLISDDDIKEKIEKQLKKFNKGSISQNEWQLFKETLNELVSKTITTASSEIISTNLPNDIKERYYKILGYTPEEYMKDINTIFSVNMPKTSINFIKKGNVLQTINVEDRLPISFNSGKGSMFASDNTLRDWYDSNEYCKFTTMITIDRYVDDDNKYEHADAIPAHAINVYNQILIILYCHFECHDEERLFKVLLATRLNMTFVNILANVLEQKKFNDALLNSFIIESEI